MKKITLVSFMVLVLIFSTRTIAQTLNQNAGWPNTNWTVTGTFNTDPLAFEADPTLTTNFAFDDNEAGSSSDDSIAAESPVIDLTVAATAGETWLTVTVDYVYNQFEDNEKLAVQYFDADGAAWVDWQVIATEDTAGAPINDFCSGTSENFVSQILDISGFTATQLSGFQYRLFFEDDLNAVGWGYGFCFQAPTITSETPPTDLLDYYNLQFPATGTIDTGGSFDVYAQAYEAGLTDATAGQATGIEAWIGYNVSDTDPSGAGWTWVAATFNSEAGNNDEYTLNLGASITLPGTYYYASRWRLNGGVYTYGGIQADGSYGGIWGDDNNISGVLTVNSIANDLCADAVSLVCDTPLNGSTIGTTGGSSSSCIGSIGNDVWYQFSGNDSTVDLTVTTSTANEEAQVEVYNSTDGTCSGFTLATCFESAGSGANPVLLSFDAVVGTEYFIRVGNWINGNAGIDFSITATCTPFPACGDPFDLLVFVAESTADILWTAPISGTPSGYNWEVQPAGVAQGTPGGITGNTATTSDTVMGLAGTTAYDLFVQTDCGVDGTSEWVGPYSFTTLGGPPPANDLCADAVVLTPGLIFETNALAGQTQLNATSDTGASEPSCSTYDPTDPSGFGGDIWYSVVVPADGNITIEAQGDPVGNGGDTGMAVYSGVCDALTEVNCNDDGSTDGFYSLVNIADPTLANQTLYVRIFEYGGDAQLSMQVSAYSATLSVDDFENTNGFSYFPNPVKNTLNLRAQNTIQDVAIYNMLGQEVLRTTPNSITSHVDMAALQSGAYFVKVTINDVTETIRIIKQ